MTIQPWKYYPLSFKAILGRIFIAQIALIFSALGAIPAIADSEGAILRVGIVAYDEITSRAKNMQSDFQEIGYTLRFARGTAEEVLDWVTAGEVDVAILSPGALAATDAALPRTQRNLAERNGILPYWSAEYLVTRAQNASLSPFARHWRKLDGDYFYEPVALMRRDALAELRKDYTGTDLELLRAAAHDNRIQFVFGDPLSLSGTIVPKAQLAGATIPVRGNWEYSFGHSDTIHLLLQPESNRDTSHSRARVGFVFDASLPKITKGKNENLDQLVERMKNELLAIALPPPAEPPQALTFVNELRTKRGVPSGVALLPSEVWVTRPDMDSLQRNEIRSALLGVHRNGVRPFRAQDEFGAPNELEMISIRVKFWADLGGVSLGTGQRPRPVNFSEIVHSMRHFERREQQPARLALVLSGGGAKCAYQVGAIAQLEREIVEMSEFKLLQEKLSPTPASRSADFNLVVGTSGGAINALPTAIGITKSKDGTHRLASLWTSMTLTRILDLSTPASLALGFLYYIFSSSFVLLAVMIIWGCGRLISASMLKSDQIARPKSCTPPWTIVKATLWIICLLNAVALLLLASSLVEWDVGRSRLLYYGAVLPIVSGWIGVIFGIVLTLAMLVTAGRYAKDERVNRFGFLARFGFMCLVLEASFLWATLILQPSLSSGDRMQEAMLGGFIELMSAETRTNRSRSGTIEQKMSALSSAIADADLRRERDFAMTVSLFGDHRIAERYAYLPANKFWTPPSYERRALQLNRDSRISFLEDSTQIVSLLVASGTIFPIFSAREFVDPAGRMVDHFIIDGGFGHNTPIEAAVDWGATHVIVVEASPKQVLEVKPSLLANLGGAFDHLFNQAQATDTRSMTEVEIYTLRPSTEILKTLDFIPTLLLDAVAQGKADVKNGGFHQFSRAPRMESFDN